ncbi:MAG: Co2+/Mg2+ efflux protein ApaG [Myxococcales bacterium]|nr:Co2+/Mg2+ efflux protein ApaG [Myxococcales bacterium]
MSNTVTRGVRVRVRSQFVPERSDPAEPRWFFAYEVRIENLGAETVQLRSRHWVITDGDGRVEHVRGPGVVGEQPRLSPGQGFRYSSACPLPTPVGTMHGSYEMETEAGDRFEAAIAPFRLAVDELIH